MLLASLLENISNNNNKYNDILKLMFIDRRFIQ